MHHDLIRILRIVAGVAFAPIITDGVSKDVTVLIERRCRDRAANCWVALKSVFRDAVPEVECAV